MTSPARISGDRLILCWIATVCALTVACEMWPELGRVVSSLSDGALIAGTTLAVTYLGWVACTVIRKALGRRRQNAGQRGRVRR